MKKQLLLSAALLPICGMAGEVHNLPATNEATPAPGDRPNIILFLVDDMGWQDTSLPFWTQRTKYNDIYHTPNMERMAAQGRMFTQAYACSISSPTRVSLFTGMNAARHRVTSWTLRKNTTHEQPDSIMTYPEWNVNGICQEPGVERTTQVTSLAEVLKDNGYHTIHCGKAHFGAEGTPGADPLKMGFEVNIAGHAAGSPASYYGKENFGNKTDGKSPLAAVPGLEKYHGTDTFLSEALTIEAMKALDDAQQTDKPFFLYMAHYAIHTPIQPDMRFYQKYIDQGLPPVEAAYATLIEGMDKSLGDLMDYLDKNNLTENTVLLFMSDNGGLAAHTRAGQLHTQNFPLNSGKGSAYEGGVREPMIVRWPGVVAPQTKCDHYLMIEDFYPTILEIAGVDNYKTVQQRDGISFLPLLTDQGKVENRDIYWHYPHSWGPSGPGIGATCSIRSGDWKLVYYFGNGKHELFNITADIGEMHDMAAQNPELVSVLSQKLGDYLRSVDAQRPTLRATGQLAPWPDEAISTQENGGSSLDANATPQQSGKPATTRRRRAPRTDHGPTGINLSLWKNIATQRTDTVGTTCLNLGVSSMMNRLDGFGLNILGSIIGRDANGVQIAGLSNIVGGSMNGVQIAGISNVNGDNLTGLSLSGLVGITGNNARGAIISGLTSISGENNSGLTIGGLLNISGANAAGFHFGGLANIAGGDFKGVSASGLLNVVGEDMNGVQLAGLGNITAGDVTGIQISGLGNVVGGTAKGVQLSPANVAIHAKGLQIGLFNYYKKSLDGFQLGLVNANPHTKVQMMIFGGNATKLNVGARFKNKLFYTILGGGTHYLDFGDKFSAALFYRAGLELPLYKQLFISGDLGYQHIETFKNKDYGIPARLYALQARVNLEYRLTERLGVFLTGGYGGSRYYTRGATYDKGVIVEGGLVITP